MSRNSLLGTPKGEDNQGQRPPSHALSADDKAAKVAALSQALDFIDKFRKSQESKEDKTGQVNLHWSEGIERLIDV